MKTYIPYEKLSKKEKRKLDQAKRQTWGEINPVTRKPKNSRAYDRKKAQNWKQEFSGSALFRQKTKKPRRFRRDSLAFFFHASLSSGFSLSASTHSA